jgi:hypothetical protein
LFLPYSYVFRFSLDVVASGIIAADPDCSGVDYVGAVYVFDIGTVHNLHVAEFSQVVMG